MCLPRDKGGKELAPVEDTIWTEEPVDYLTMGEKKTNKSPNTLLISVKKVTPK